MTNKELLEMNNDRELLENAAKVAGVKGKYNGIACEFYLEEGELDPANQGRSWWNPLTDDGDALRLAVKLGLDVRNGLYTDMVFVDCFGIDAVEIEYGDDPYAATRRAIVRAAASIVEQSEAVSSSSLMRTAAEIGKATV